MALNVETAGGAFSSKISLRSLSPYVKLHSSMGLKVICGYLLTSFFCCVD